MVAIEAFISRLKREGISLWLDEGNIRYRAPPGKLTPELKTELRALKAPIIDWLQQSDEGALRIPMLARQSRPEAIPLSFAQERLWVLDRLTGSSTAYNELLITRLSGPLDISILERCLSEIIRRHEALRTRIVCIDGQPSQVIDPPRSIDIRFTDVSALSDEERDRRVKEESEAEHSKVFDLERDPLLRAALICLRRDEHVLLIPHHHIVSDGWSIGVVLSELSALYSSFVQSKPSPLQDLPIQYADFALWQRRWLKGELLAKQVAYWHKLLEGAPSVLKLPIDKPRLAAGVRKGALFRFSIPCAAVEGVRALAKSEQASLFMVLLAAFQVVLTRWTGEDDIVVGSPISGRRDHQTVGLVGFFVNTLVFRGSFSEDQSIREFVRRTKANALGNYANQDVPFEKLVETLRVNRDLNRTPIFQVMFSLEASVESISMHDIVMEPVASDAVPDCKFDLSLTVSEVGSALHGTFEYPVDLFLPATIERISEYFVKVLSAMTVDADQNVLQIDLLPPAEREFLLGTCNRTEAPYPSDICIHQLFEQQVRQRPDASAVEYDGQSLTYAELNAQANRLAHYLIERGIKPDDRVAICVERSVEMLVGLLGILKAGGAYVPLDPAYPTARLAYMLSDSDPVALLTQEALRESISGWAASTVPLVVLDAEERAAHWTLQPEYDPNPNGLASTHLAYVIYTSGSTGQPKGVMVEHRNAANLIAAHIAHCELTQLDRVLQFASFSFDASVEEIFPVLSVGATVILRPAEVAPDRSFTRLLHEQRITIVELPTAFWHQWVGSAEFESCLSETVVRLVVIGGEKADAHAFAAWSTGCRGRPCHLLNTYGPTEATVYASAVRFDNPQALPLAVVPIGKPIGNVKIYVLDARREPVPLGVAGEIYIGGIQVARGYLNRSELTRERFVADPFSSSDDARMYRTGDLGRWSPDGSIEYLGRNDHQVKIRGFRIELGEIEAQLQCLPDVRAAAVLAREDVPGEKRLVAYIQARDDRAPTAAELRELLAGQLPEHMLPSAFVRLAVLPQTPNGKIDRAALPAPDDTSVARREYEAPVGEIEQALARIWQDLLRVERVGRHDHFFELGGHSLLAIRLLSRLQQAVGVRLPLAMLFTHTTLESLAAVVTAAVADADQPTQSPIESVSRAQPLHLSYAQQRLWFLDQLDHAAGAAYHMPSALRLKGELNRQALRAALDRIVARHESLRTRFVLAEGAPVQEIGGEESGFALSEQDLRGLSVAEQEAAIAHISEVEVKAPFDLSQGPLIRGRLLRVAQDEHILLVTQHHIISDGWSVGVLVREVSALYAAYSLGQADPLPELRIQYADYAAWQRQWLQGEVLEGQIAFWREHLRGAPELLAMPTDRARPTLQSYAGGSVSLRLPPELTQRLRRLSQRHGTTLFMTLLAGWSVLLSRWSGQSQVVIGTPVANRQRTEIEGLIGFFVNTLALRVDVQADPSVAQLLSQVKATTLAAYSHQDVPFEQVVEALQPVRSLSHSPLFQVMLTLDNTPSDTELTLPGLSLSTVHTPHSTTHFDLSLSFVEGAEEVLGSLEYASDLFEQSTVERMVGHLELVLQGMVQDEHQRVTEVALLTAAERQQVLEQFNATQVDYRQERLIHELFEEQVQREPEAIALVYEQERISYGELNAQANQVAHELIGLGVRPDDRVGICMERSIGMVVGLLGILKAGGAYVPLDPGYPQERLAYMVRDSAPVVLVTRKGLRGQVEVEQIPVLELDDLQSGHRQRPRHNADARERGLNAHHLAYVIYTSGSTGMPKGVMVEHRNVLGLVVNNSYAVLTREDCVAHCANPAFDASTWEIWGALLHGARLLIVAQSVLLDPRAFDKALMEGGVTALWLTVGLFNEFVDKLDAWGRLKFLLVGGDVLDPRAIARLLHRDDPPRHVINGYGPTETTTFATTFEIQATTNSAQTIPIGRPIANTRIYILDGRGEPVPVGVAGEIYIAGAGVARGYLNRPELTAERFVEDRFNGEGNRRMYKSGDLGRWLPDGTIEYLGRDDEQVKIRGFRIELGEIQARLADCAGVREAVVLARKDSAGDKRLVAYVVNEEGAQVSLGELREQLGRTLPEYMVPSAYVRMQALPLTPNGKLDRHSLPAPDQAAVVSRAYEAPEGEVEQAVAEVWKELLGLERVGRQDQFFELGGHSLLAVQLVSRIRHALKVEVALRDLFARPTLSAFAQVVVQGGAAAQDPIVVADRSGVLPLSWGQQRLWFLAQLDGGSAAYHIPLVWRLRGALNVSAWIRSLNALYARHEALRTVFVCEDGVLRVELLPADSSLPLVEHDLRGSADAMGHLNELSRNEVGAPFDLTRGPLIRGRLVRLMQDDHVFLLTQHHIISDGWSLSVMARELAALYTAFTQGQVDPLPPLAVQYPDYAAWQRQWLAGERLQVQTDYWRQVLADAPVRLELPTDRPRPARQSFAGASLPVHLDAELTRDLKQLSQAHGVTLFMTLLAAWATVLARLSGQDDLIIGSPTAGRCRQELEPLIGFFVNTLALRIDLSGAPSGTELLARVRRTALAAQDHQDLPFEQVVEIAQPPRHPDHTPLFQVMFAWQNNEMSTAKLPGLSIEAAEMPVNTVKFDLELSLGETDGVIVGGLSYATELFDGATIERHRHYLLAALQALVADVDQPVARIDLLPAAERALLLDSWNRTEAACPIEQCIHQLFEQQASERPNAIAVIHDGESLTYAELNAHANRLAHYLIERGIKPDDRVAICVERSLAMVVGLLAILKAGGAYVPLDPSYPAERLTQLLSDCSPRMLFTDAAGRLALGDPAMRAASHHTALDSVWDEYTGYSSDDPDPKTRGLTPRHLAYIIYTSGSTGTPKGVMVEHAQIVRLFDATRTLFDFDETDTWCLFHSFAFDFSVWEMWGAWRHGGRLLIVPRDVARSADDFHRLVCTAGVTVLNQTPSAFRGFIEVSSRADLKCALRYVIFGGEALEMAMLKAWYARHSDLFPRLVNMYGITETTVHVTHHVLQEADCARRGSPIGRPIPDLRIYLLDTLGQPVPLGAIGEIHVGGAGVARGYLNRPELTAARFLDDPFIEVAGARMYRSGDLARYLPDGRLEFLGRNDHQVKIRGFRIELGEIEARLAEHAWVKEAVVRAVEDDTGDKRLIAYLVLKEGANADAPINVVRSYLAQRLPDYMVPVAYVPIAKIPLTAHGKLDTKVLPKPDGAALARRRYEAPRTTEEEILCDVWSDVLQVDRVGVNDNFFEIGGDSILSLKIVRGARARGLEISVNDVFAHQTVAGLAPAAKRFANDKRIDVDDLHFGKELRHDLPPTVEDAYPLTAMQTLMVDEYKRNSEHGLGIYHVQQFFEFKDVRPSADAMHRALKLLMAAHPVLRTTLIQAGASTVQGITSEDAFTFEFVDEDLRAYSDAEREMRLRVYMMRDRKRAFGNAALLRFAWFRTADNMFVLIHSIHHAIDDGWGNQHFLNQLFQSYISLRNSDTASVERSGNVFREYVALQFELAKSAEAQAFWTSLRFHPCGVDTLQRHYGRAQNQYGAIMTIDSKATGKLRATAKFLKVSLKAVLLGAYLEMIKAVACTGSPTVGIVVNGRSDSLSDPLGSLGLFWNMLPFGQDEWIVDRNERLCAIQRDLVEMERYAVFPHNSIEQRRGSSGLFFATFNYVDFHNARSLPANEGIELTRVYGHDKFHYPLNYAFSVDRSNDTISVHVQYDNEYFDGRDVHASNVTLLDLLEHFGAMTIGPDCGAIAAEIAPRPAM